MSECLRDAESHFSGYVTETSVRKDFLGGLSLRDHWEYVLGVGYDDLQKIGFVGFEHFADAVTQVFSLGYSAGLNAEPGGHGDEVRVDGVLVVGAT